MFPGFMGTRKISGVELNFFSPCLPKNLLYLICLFLFLLSPFPSFSLYLSMCLVYMSPNGILNSQCFAGNFIEIPYYSLHTVSQWIGHRLGPASPIQSTMFKEVTIWYCPTASLGNRLGTAICLLHFIHMPVGHSYPLSKRDREAETHFSN